MLSFITVACLFCLLVLLSLSAYIYVLVCCFWRCCLFVCSFVFGHFVQCTFCCCIIFAPRVPHSTQFFDVSACFFRASRLWDIVAACCVASFVFLFSFASFSPTIYDVFRFWALFKHLQICLFWLFLVVSCTFVAWPVCACMWFDCRALCASKSSLYALWCSCDNHTMYPCSHVPPSHNS